MDLALLVYGISLLGKIENFLIFIVFISASIAIVAGVATATWKFDGSEYSWNLNKDGTVKEKILESRLFGEKAFKYSLIAIILTAIVLVFIPNEKTAYTMVGAYAAQKVVENDKVQNMSGKVLKIIEQKLDTYIDEAEKQATNAVKGTK